MVSIHKLTAREELLFLRGEGWGEVAEDPLLDFSEISEKVVPYLKDPYSTKYVERETRVYECVLA